MKKIIILNILILTIFGCTENDSKNDEKEIGVKIAQYVIKNDSLNQSHYSRKVYFHIMSEKISENYFRTHITINGLKSDSKDFLTDTIEVGNFESIIYHPLKKSLSFPDSFFVPDSRSYVYLVELVEKDMFFYELKPIFMELESGFDNEESTDF